MGVFDRVNSVMVSGAKVMRSRNPGWSRNTPSGGEPYPNPFLRLKATFIYGLHTFEVEMLSVSVLGLVMGLSVVMVLGVHLEHVVREL